MDTSRKVNANAGKGGKYRPGEIAENFGQPNMAAPGSGASSYARIRTQAHGAARGSSAPPTDRSSDVGSRGAPGMSVGNTGPHPAGVAGPAPSVAGKGVNRTMSMPGDAQPGRRGSATDGAPLDRYRKKY